VTRILLIHPGASFSTADVFNGVHDALLAQGQEVVEYSLADRLTAAGGWLGWSWEHSKKEIEKPTPADTMYLASVGALERALRHGVDVVLNISSMFFHPDVLLLMKRAHLKTAVLFTESPYDDEWQLKMAPYLDACWVNERSSLAKFRAVQPNTFYWQQAYDPERHLASADDEGVAAHDVVFVGTGFQERIDMLRGADWTGIDLGLYGSWDLLGSRNRLRTWLKGGVVDNRLAAALYRQAKIGLNLHRTSVGFGRKSERIEYAESINPRCYELAACGRFFVSDYRAELDEIFSGIVPTFRTSGELEKLVRHYLSRDAERDDIARQLPALVAEHTFANRVATMIGQLKGL
jgi:spore maturation protein CgeB